MDKGRRKWNLNRVEWFLFLTLWFAYGLVINSANLQAFGLQQAGVEAYVERRNLYLEGSPLPQHQVQPVVDAFLYKGHIYPAKQPGQFMAGASAYSLLRLFGLSYSNNYLLTAALVTFLTASLVMALSVVAVFKTAREFLSHTDGLLWPMLIALAYGLGTTVFAYSGIPWHDTLATGYLTMGFYLIVRTSRSASGGRRFVIPSAAAGAFLGLTITTSLLPFFMVAILAVYFVSLRRWRLLPAFCIGILLGLAPLLIYNFICFGNPFLVPNIAGNYSDTFFHFQWGNFVSKLRFYSWMLTLYVPIFWLGIIGLAYYRKNLRREQLLIAGMLAALAAYILNIAATGTCQYGPRYLLPAMPFAMLGLLGFKFVSHQRFKTLSLVFMAALGLTSFFINLVGAMHGAMLCDFPHSALLPYLAEMSRGDMRSFPLAAWLAIPCSLCGIMLIRCLRQETVHYRRHIPG